MLSSEFSVSSSQSFFVYYFLQSISASQFFAAYPQALPSSAKDTWIAMEEI